MWIMINQQTKGVDFYCYTPNRYAIKSPLFSVLLGE